ncbi:MAG: DMT family transporter [Planctomycetaceae bacterium]|nr:DMT family transporter [Planctomycetaceae bacterium]
MSTIAWGMSYLCVKVALRTLGTFNMVALRFSIACAFTAFAFSGHARRIRRAELFYGCCLGGLLFCSASLLATGVANTSISNAGFIIGSMVLFVSVMDTLVSWRRPRAGLFAAVPLAMAGIAILTLRGEFSLNPGDLYCLGATIALAVHVMVAQQAGRHADAVGASIIQFAVTGSLAWLASTLQGGAVLVPSGDALYAVLALGVFGTAVAFVCQVVGQKYVSPTRTAFIFTLEPIFATLFAWLFMREHVTWHVFAGGGMLLAAVYISELGAAANTDGPSITQEEPV